MPRRDPRLDQIPATVNEAIADRSIRHALFLEKLKAGEVRRILALYDDVLPDLLDRIELRLNRIAERGFDPGPATTERLQQMAAAINKATEELRRESQAALTSDMVDLAKDEAQFQLGVVRQSLPVSFDMVLPSTQTLRSVVTARPFDGRLLKDWFRGLEAAQRSGLRQAIRLGITEGETTAQIVRRIRGTRAANFTDGVVGLNRRQAEAVVRSAVTHVSSHAREATFEANTDLVKGVQWVATLDSRTCFPAGTLVQTINGHRPIETISVDDFVLTHTGRYRRVTETMSRFYRGPMVTVRVGSSSCTATVDHPFLTAQGWEEAGQLDIGDGLFEQRQNQAMRSVGVVPAGPSFVGREMERHQSVASKAAVSPLFLGFVLVPVRAIDFQRDVVAGQNEIDGEPTDRHLLAVADSEFAQAPRDMALGSRAPGVCAVAVGITELTVLRRTDAPPVPAISAVDVPRWTAAFLRTMPACLRGAVESLAAPLTDSHWVHSAGSGAAAISMRVACVDFELLATRLAGLLDLARSREKAHAGTVGLNCSAWAPEFCAAPLAGIASLLARSIAFLRAIELFGLSGPVKPLPTLSARAHVGRLSLRDAATSMRAIFAGRPLANESPTTLNTDVFGHVEVTDLKKFDWRGQVYNIEVEADHTYIAEGLVVHNCQECMALDGKVFEVGKGRRPPAHQNCRCSTTGITKSWKELGVDLSEAPPGTRASMNGQVPDTVTYGEWLKTQTKDIQDMALGPTRGVLFRKGELSVESFTDRRGELFTLDELRRREADAFEAAGV